MSRPSGPCSGGACRGSTASRGCRRSSAPIRPSSATRAVRTASSAVNASSTKPRRSTWSRRSSTPATSPASNRASVRATTRSISASAAAATARSAWARASAKYARPTSRCRRRRASAVSARARATPASAARTRCPRRPAVSTSCMNLTINACSSQKDGRRAPKTGYASPSNATSGLGPRPAVRASALAMSTPCRAARNAGLRASAMRRASASVSCGGIVSVCAAGVAGDSRNAARIAAQARSEALPAPGGNREPPGRWTPPAGRAGPAKRDAERPREPVGGRRARTVGTSKAGGGAEPKLGAPRKPVNGIMPTLASDRLR